MKQQAQHVMLGLIVHQTVLHCPDAAKPSQWKLLDLLQVEDHCKANVHSRSL